MPSTTPLQSWPVPSGGDAPSSVAAFAAFGSAAEGQAVMRFASTSARDAAIAVGNRKAGMIAWIDGLGYHTRVTVNGGVWSPLASIDAFRGNEAFEVGSAPPAGTLKIREEDSAITTVGNAAGRFDIPFHVPFPNGLVSVQMTLASASGTCMSVRHEQLYSSLTSMSGVAYNSNGTYLGSGGGLRCNYAAVGW